MPVMLHRLQSPRYERERRREIARKRRTLRMMQRERESSRKKRVLRFDEEFELPEQTQQNEEQQSKGKELEVFSPWTLAFFDSKTISLQFGFRRRKTAKWTSASSILF